jgi:CHAT domain-containing protein
VLAACDLGMPGDLLGQELEGVLAALLYGGAAGVVAAVTSVPDRETSALMTDLHEQLASGASLSEATATARARRDPSVPAELVVRTAFSCYGGG